MKATHCRLSPSPTRRADFDMRKVAAFRAPRRSHIPALVRRGAAVMLMTLAWLGTAITAQAQGLIWNLPADGTEVRYQGTFKQTDSRPGGQEAVMSWESELLIRSVGTQQVTYEGKEVPGRWLELESRTGKNGRNGN